MNNPLFKIRIKPAQMTEYDIVETFYRTLIESMRDSEFMPEWEMGVYPTEKFLRDAITGQTLYLAYLREGLVGAMILNHEYAPEYENVKWQIDAGRDEIMVIHALGVSASYQGRGIAKKMVSSVIEMCKNSSFKAIRLDVLKKNIPAAKLYLSMGFKYIATIKIYYEDTGLTDFQLYEWLI